MVSVPVWSFFLFFFYLIIIDSWTNRSGNCIRDFLSHFMLFCDICHQVVYALNSSGKQPQTGTAIIRQYSWTGSFSPRIESDAGMYIHHSDRSTFNVIPWTADQIYSFGAGYSSLQALDSQSILLLHTVALWCCQPLGQLKPGSRCLTCFRVFSSLPWQQGPCFWEPRCWCWHSQGLPSGTQWLTRFRRSDSAALHIAFSSLRPGEPLEEWRKN